MTIQHRKDNAPQFTKKDMCYLAGVCVHSYYIGNSKTGAPELVEKVGDEIFESPGYHETALLYPGDALYLLVQKALPDMITFNDTYGNPALNQEMHVKNDALAMVTRLEMAQTSYRSGFYTLSPAVTAALEAIYEAEPILIEGQSGLKELRQGTAKEVIDERETFGSSFFACVQEHLDKRKRALTEPQKPEDKASHSFLDNLKSMFGSLFHKKPKKDKGNQHEM